MTALASVSPAAWPAPLEPIWQMLPGFSEPLPACKRSDVGVVERLFIGAVVNVPRAQRPWGVITWLGTVFRVSRPTLYAIGERCAAGLQAPPPASPPPAPSTPVLAPETPPPPSRSRLLRTLLTLLVPGGVSESQAPLCVAEALSRHCSVGFTSELLQAAGRRAGQVLDTVDHRPMGPVTLARDEIYTGRAPNLLLVEPRSLTIAGLYATADCDTETWALALLLTQGRGVDIQQLVEDDCRAYHASCAAIGLTAPEQKDVWHPGHAAEQVITAVAREALRALKPAEQAEKHLRRRWDTAEFAIWAAALEQAERLWDLSNTLRFWTGCVWDALEIVDGRSGEIRDRAINQWLLAETLTALRGLAHPRVQALVNRLDAQADELSTCLDFLAPALAAWQTRVAAHFPNPAWARFFQACVARAWRLEQAVQSGHSHFRAAAHEAREWVLQFGVEDPDAATFASELEALLDATIRASSAAETINSVLRPYFNGRREGAADTESRQLFLNLFTLWFNLHKFESGPRKGHSPYELAGIDLGSDDWLTVLGFPPD